MHDFTCKEPGCEFTSTAWPSKAARDARGRQHRTEHETGEPMPELADNQKGDG